MPSIKTIIRSHYFFIFVLLISCISLSAQNKRYILPPGFNVLTNMYDNDLWVASVTHIKKRKDSVLFYTYDLQTAHGNNYVSSIKPAWTVKYYNKKDKQSTHELYEAIRHGKAIKNAVIDELNLDSLGNYRGDSLVIEDALIFEFCVIKEIIVPQHFVKRSKRDTVSGTDSSVLLFSKLVRFHKCSLGNIYLRNAVFNRGISLVDNSFNAPFEPGCEFINSIFMGPTEIVNDYGGQLLLMLNDIALQMDPSDKKFIDTSGPKTFGTYYRYDDAFFSVDTTPKFLFRENCVFYGKTAIVNTNPYYQMDFSGADFRGDLYVTRFYRQYHSDWEQNFQRFTDKPDFINAYPQQNLNFSFAKFEYNFFADNETFRNVNFADAGFTSTISMINSFFQDSLSESKGFYYSHCKKNLAVMLDPKRFSIANLNFNNPTVKNIEFAFINTHKEVIYYTPVFMDNLNSFYDRVIVDCKQVYASKPDLASDLENKYSHEKTEYEIHYLWHNPWPFGCCRWLWLNILELTVGNGYNGGFNFFMSTLILILSFSIIYYWKFRSEIVEYVNKINTEKGDTPEIYKSYQVLRNGVKCFWQSCIVFINPKFNSAYFKFPKWLFYFIILEWVLGVFMIILFLIYIATTYSFVRELIGL